MSTTNGRKRILDDRTNNVKTTAAASNASIKPPTKAGSLTRKVSNAATKKPLMVLDEVKPSEPLSKRAIKPIKKESSTRHLTRKASTTDVQQNAAMFEYAGPSAQAKAATSKTSTAPLAQRRQVSRLNKAAPSNTIENGLLEAPYDAGHVAKKVRTSEPDEALKENQPEQNPDKQKAVKKEATRGAKSQVVLAQQKAVEQDWEDLDEGDEEDPLMVREYVTEIYHYMRELEAGPSPHPSLRDASG